MLTVICSEGALGDCMASATRGDAAGAAACFLRMALVMAVAVSSPHSYTTCHQGISLNQEMTPADSHKSLLMHRIGRAEMSQPPLVHHLPHEHSRTNKTVKQAVTLRLIQQADCEAASSSSCAQGVSFVYKCGCAVLEPHFAVRRSLQSRMCVLHYKMHDNT